MLLAIALAVLVKLLLETENPVLCAGFFTALALIFQLLALGLSSVALIDAVLGVASAFVLSFAYFWLLNRIETAYGLPPV